MQLLPRAGREGAQGAGGVSGTIPHGSAGSAKVCLPQNSVDCVPEVDGFYCM